MVETDECPYRATAPSALAYRTRTLIPAGSAAARSGKSARALAGPCKCARPPARRTCASRRKIGRNVAGFGRTGTLACPRVQERYCTGQTGVSVLPSKLRPCGNPLSSGTEALFESMQDHGSLHWNKETRESNLDTPPRGT